MMIDRSDSSSNVHIGREGDHRVEWILELALDALQEATLKRR